MFPSAVRHASRIQTGYTLVCAEGAFPVRFVPHQTLRPRGAERSGFQPKAKALHPGRCNIAVVRVATTDSNLYTLFCRTLVSWDIYQIKGDAGMRDVFKRIGGRAAVDAAVDRFYEYMLSDERVKHFFDDVNMEKQRQHQKDFITYALGGSPGYSGNDLRTAHQPLVDKLGLSDEHFDATVENLVKALRDLNVAEDVIADAGAILESTRDDVLCR